MTEADEFSPTANSTNNKFVFQTVVSHKQDDVAAQRNHGCLKKPRQELAANLQHCADLSARASESVDSLPSQIVSRTLSRRSVLIK